VTINAEESIKTLLQHTNPDNRKIIIYHQDNEKISSKIIAKKNVFPISCKSGMSHLSLSLKPDNYWAGQNGIYRSCIHYKRGSEKYQQCKTAKDIYFGEITKENLKHYKIVARSTYNIFADKLYLQIDKFLNLVK
jgi:hypothetical protein